jgi:hypothetical protein
MLGDRGSLPDRFPEILQLKVDILVVFSKKAWYIKKKGGAWKQNETK